MGSECWWSAQISKADFARQLWIDPDSDLLFRIFGIFRIMLLLNISKKRFSWLVDWDLGNGQSMMAISNVVFVDWLLILVLFRFHVEFRFFFLLFVGFVWFGNISYHALVKSCRENPTISN